MWSKHHPKRTLVIEFICGSCNAANHREGGEATAQTGNQHQLQTGKIGQMYVSRKTISEIKYYIIKGLKLTLKNVRTIEYKGPFCHKLRDLINRELRALT